MATQLILGGPGCGKTTYQLGLMEKALAQGTPPDRIAFVSFTKAAVDEARNRAKEAFGLRDDDLPYFRTLHSLCFRELGLRRSDVLDDKDWDRIGAAAGVTFSNTKESMKEDATPGEGATPGDRARSIISYAYAVRAKVQDVWHHFGEDLSWWVVERLLESIVEYKSTSHKVEFSDMLSLYLRRGSDIPVDLAMIDEAQDLTAAQWGVARRAFGGGKRVFVSGDDDQAIHTWAGAATRMFQDLQGPRVVLPVSHRLSKEVWELGNQITSKISHRLPKDWAPAEHAGSITHVEDWSDVDIDPARGTWMILVRNNYQLRPVANALRSRGLLYRTRSYCSVSSAHVRGIVSWERSRQNDVSQVEQEWALEFAGKGALRSMPWFDALTGIPLFLREYYRTLLRRGIRLQDEPKILLSTIHGVKGGEADHVVLMTDISRRVALAMEQNPDAEHRVFFVGATRARHSLTIVAPEQRELSYIL